MDKCTLPKGKDVFHRGVAGSIRKWGIDYIIVAADADDLALLSEEVDIAFDTEKTMNVRIYREAPDA